jgi:uncharacterized membrane protein YfcA
MLEHFDALHAVAGLLVGILVGLTGVGGGSLMTPILVLIFGVNPGTAVGTDLLFASLTKIVGSTVHGKRNTIDWPIMARLAAGSVPAAIAALVVLSWAGKVGKQTSHTILLVLGVMLILTSIATLFQKRIVALARGVEATQAGHCRCRQAGLGHGGPGRGAGRARLDLVGGAGAIGVTALLMLYPTLRISRIVGTDIAHAVPLTMVAGFGHWIIGDVNLALLAALLLGSIPGVIVGSLLSTRAPDRILRPALAAVLLISGIKLLS